MEGRELTHVDPSGRARMVDVSGKPLMLRTAVAGGALLCRPDTVVRLAGGRLPKGDALAVARVAAIAAAKRTSELIPLAHPVALDWVAVDLEAGPDRISITATVRCRGATGVEMEALTAVAAAALTLYDMCKAIDSTMRISEIRLEDKTKEPIGPADRRPD